MSDLYLYVLVRTDMPSMKQGKSCAHAAHAANQFTFEHYVMPLKAKKKVDPTVESWHEEANGFGTTIALDVTSGDQMRDVVAAAQKLGFAAGVTTDPTYPYFVDREVFGLLPDTLHTMPPVFMGPQTLCFRKEDTCAYVFGRKADLAVLLKQFNLLAND